MCVDVGLECDKCIWGLVLNVNMVNGGFECEVYSLFRAGGNYRLNLGLGM